jgi:tetrahydromethanopterin S-methyltransferase subunit G
MPGEDYEELVKRIDELEKEVTRNYWEQARSQRESDGTRVLVDVLLGVAIVVVWAVLQWRT